MMFKRTLSLLATILLILSCSNSKETKHSVIVSKNNTVVFETYYNGKTKDSLANVQSLTKGVISILIGIAIDKKYISSENELIENYFSDAFKTLSDKKKKNITIKHLLNQTSGLSWEGYLEHENWLNASKPIDFVLNKPLESVPGEKYNYNSGATHLLSVIISKATGKSTLEFAKAHLFEPLSISTFNWEKRNQGYYDGSGLGLEMKPRDLLKIGQLVITNGSYNSNQILSPEWIEKMVNNNEKKPTKWGIRNSTHGYCWYKAELNNEQLDYGMGYGGQFIIINQNKGLVIVATHNNDTPDGIEQQIEFLNKTLPALIKKYGS